MEGMDLIRVVVLIAVVGVLLWAMNKYLPMEATIKQILNFVVIILVVIYLLMHFHLLPV